MEGTAFDESQRKKISDVASRMHSRVASTHPVTSNATNRVAFGAKPDNRLSNQVVSRGMLSNKVSTVDWKMKPESKSSKEDTCPVIAAVEGGFHTQYLLFTKNNAVPVSDAAKSPFLLKIQSNCCWDSIRHRVLDMIIRQCPNNTFYPLVEQLRIDGFVVEILPKANRPEILPADVQKKLKSRYLNAINIRITVDRSAVGSPLRTSMATGLSAFTKLQLKFSSEKLHGGVKSSQSFEEHTGGVVPQLSRSCSFGPFASKPMKTGLSAPSATGTATHGDTETVRLQAAKPTNSVRPKPAILRSSSLSSGDRSSTKLDSAGESKLRSRCETELAGQPVISVVSPVAEQTDSTVQSASDRSNVISSTKLSSSSVVPPSVDLKGPIVPVRGPESAKLTNHVVQSGAKSASDSHHALKAVPGSLFAVGQNPRETMARLPVEVIVVEEDDSVPPCTSVAELAVTSTVSDVSSVHCSSVQLSAALSLSSVLHSSSKSDVVQVVNVPGNSTSPGQSVSDVAVLSQAAVHSVSVASVGGNGSSLTIPVTSVSSPSLTCSLPASAEQSILNDTSLPAVISSHAVDIEQVAEGQRNEKVERSASRAEPSLTGSDVISVNSTIQHPVDTKTAVPDIPQPVINKIVSVSLTCDEELSGDDDNCMMGHKPVDTGQQCRDVECLSAAVTSVPEVVSTDCESQLSLAEFKPVHRTEPSSSSTVNEHRQPCSSDIPDAATVPENVLEIVPSDEVRPFCSRGCGLHR